MTEPNSYSNQFYHRAAELLTDDSPYKAVHVKRVQYFTRLMQQNPLFEQGANLLFNDLYAIVQKPEALTAADFGELHRGRDVALKGKEEQLKLPDSRIDETRGRALNALVGFQLEMSEQNLIDKKMKANALENTLELSENILKTSDKNSIGAIAARGAIQKITAVKN